MARGRGPGTHHAITSPGRGHACQLVDLAANDGSPARSQPTAGPSVGTARDRSLFVRADSSSTGTCRRIDLGNPSYAPAAAEQTVLVQASYSLVPIGWVKSALRVLDDAPNQREGAPRAWIRFDEQVAEGAKDLRPGDEVMVL